jgi:hypothetical protein
MPCAVFHKNIKHELIAQQRFALKEYVSNIKTEVKKMSYVNGRK